jgi:hypothetical protein
MPGTGPLTMNVACAVGPLLCTLLIWAMMVPPSFSSMLTNLSVKAACLKTDEGPSSLPSARLLPCASL